MKILFKPVFFFLMILTSLTVMAQNNETQEVPSNDSFCLAEMGNLEVESYKRDLERKFPHHLETITAELDNLWWTMPSWGGEGTLKFKKGYTRIFEMMRDHEKMLNLLHELAIEVFLEKMNHPGEEQARVALHAVLRRWENRAGFKAVRIIKKEEGNISQKEFNKILVNKRPIEDRGTGVPHGEDSHRIQWNLILRALEKNPFGKKGFFKEEELAEFFPEKAGNFQTNDPDLLKMGSELYAQMGLFQNKKFINMKKLGPDYGPLRVVRPSGLVWDGTGVRGGFLDPQNMWVQAVDTFRENWGKPEVYYRTIRTLYPELGNQ